MPWSTSNRRSRLPPDWRKRVAATKARAHGMCQARVHAPTCDGIGTDCDHITAGDNHALYNLQWLSRPCHTVKTQAEAGAARRHNKQSAARPHPGLLPGPLHTLPMPE